MIPTEIDPIAELTAAITRARRLADQARADLEVATPALIAAIRHGSGQSTKVEKILWSCWNDEHPVSLCDELAGLDADLTVAVIALIAARAHMAGDADDLLRGILDYDLPWKPPTTPVP